jgi:OAA-family lectin sugar binding domain
MASTYNVKNQWGGTHAAWNESGSWSLGNRGTQHIISLDIASTDGGNTLHGSMTYVGEGPIGFKGTHTEGNNYTIENQWGGHLAPWQHGGNWMIGSRPNQRVISVNAKSADGGKTLSGDTTYAGEGPIGLRLTLQ